MTMNKNVHAKGIDTSASCDIDIVRALLLLVIGC